MAALVAGNLSESYGRTFCQWTDKLPEKFRDDSDELLVAAAAAGLGLRDLGAMFAEMYERARGDLPDEDPARGFEDRGVRLETTFQGAGVLNGDLTPECAAVVGAVLDALGAPVGAEDTRTREQRYHDALQEAMCSNGNLRREVGHIVGAVRPNPLALYVPKTSSTSCDQTVFIDRAAGAGVPQIPAHLELRKCC